MLCLTAPTALADPLHYQVVVHMLTTTSWTMRRSCNDSASTSLRQQEAQAIPTLWQCHRRGLLLGAAGLLGLSLHTPAKVCVRSAS